MRIRLLKKEDLEFVIKGEETCFSDPWSRKALEEEAHLSEKNPSMRAVLVADEGGEIIGHTCLLNIAGECTVNRIAIYPGYRERGLGSELLLKSMEWGRGMGAEDFTLEVRAGNKAAVSMYDSAGFKVEGIRKNYYHDPTEDGLIMWKRK